RRFVLKRERKRFRLVGRNNGYSGYSRLTALWLAHRQMVGSRAAFYRSWPHQSEYARTLVLSLDQLRLGAMASKGLPSNKQRRQSKLEDMRLPLPPVISV